MKFLASPSFSDRLVIAVGPHGPKNSRRGLRSFADESFVSVTRTASASLHDHIIGTCHAAGFVPRIVQEVEELFTVLNFVRAGGGVALVPNSCKVMNVPRIKYLDTGVSTAAWKIGIAFHNGAASDPAVSNFVSVVRQKFYCRH